VLTDNLPAAYITGNLPFYLIYLILSKYYIKLSQTISDKWTAIQSK